MTSARNLAGSWKQLAPARVRYIKLGEGGRWEAECVRDGIIRFGYSTANPERYPLCRDGRWTDLKQSFLDEGRSKGTATQFTNETRLFFEDDGRTLWITFHGALLYWGQLVPSVAEPHPDGNGVIRRVDGGWRSTDASGEGLTTDRLSGALTKLAAFRGTTCRVDVADYTIRRINGEKMPEVERALTAAAELKAATVGLIRQLGPRDFELLVDLVFTGSGWRRLGEVGKTVKTRDLDLVLPSTGDRASVQVKSRTTSRELAEYVAKIGEQGPYDRMFFVYHSGEAVTDDDRVIVIGPVELAELVVSAGLVDWVVGKVS